eukprot:COSAG02_NODE_17511_length_998_cov_3.001112_2_plen_82_part_01
MWHVAITSDLDKDDPKKFKMGTPQEVSDAMDRTYAAAGDQVEEAGGSTIQSLLTVSAGCDADNSAVSPQRSRSSTRARTASS